MNRRTLAITAGIVILAAALLLMLWPDSQVDTSVEDEAAETALPEGTCPHRRRADPCRRDRTCHSADRRCRRTRLSGDRRGEPDGQRTDRCAGIGRRPQRRQNAWRLCASGRNNRAARKRRSRCSRFPAERCPALESPSFPLPMSGSGACSMPMSPRGRTLKPRARTLTLLAPSSTVRRPQRLQPA